MAISILKIVCTLSFACVAKCITLIDRDTLAASDQPFARLKNPQLAKAVLLEQLGLDTADMAVLVESEHRELMTTLEESGVQLGDRVKIRLWMDRTRQALMSKPYDPRRPTLQIESTAGPSSTSADRHQTFP